MFAQLKRFFFQKRGPETGRAAAEREIRWRGSPLRSLDPDGLASAIESFRAGTLAPLARIVDELELRDDTMRSCSRKMRAAAARCPHKVLIREGVGEDGRARAEAHRRALERLWGRVRVTDALQRNARGGIRLLLKQMMGAQSMAFAAHELVWTPTADGSLDLTLVHVPLQFFENRTGALRYLRDPAAQWDGEEMAEGEWLVTAGDGVGIAAAIAATFKRLSLQDWLLFSERCGQPGLHASTDARQGSEQWENLVSAVANFGREWGIVTDGATQVKTVSLANGGTPPYPALVERMDRAIATLYRGSDLSTISGGEGSVGASQQGEEADILEQDACEMLSEALQEQVERPFIRYVFGDGEPLAYIQISPVSHPNLDMEMKIDRHLAELGARLSKREALERYQRTEAAPDDPDDEALEAPRPENPGGFGGFGGLANAQTPSSVVAKALQNARRGAGATSVPKDGETRLDAILDDFSAKLAEEMQDEMFSAAAEALASDRTADKPAAGGQTGSQPAAGEAALANEDQPRGKTVAGTNDGSFAPSGGGSSGGGAAKADKPDGKDGEAKADGGENKGDGEKKDGKPEDKDGTGIYSEENAKKIGQKGDYKSLGLPPARDIPPDQAMPKVNTADAKARIMAGETVHSPLGEDLAIDKRTLKHLANHSQEDFEKRLRLLDEARETVEHPHEIWADEKHGRRVYMRMYQDPSGNAVLNAVDEVDHVLSWHSNDRSFDHWRRGRLLYVRK